MAGRPKTYELALSRVLIKNILLPNAIAAQSGGLQRLPLAEEADLHLSQLGPSCLLTNKSGDNHKVYMGWKARHSA